MPRWSHGVRIAHSRSSVTGGRVNQAVRGDTWIIDRAVRHSITIFWFAVKCSGRGCRKKKRPVRRPLRSRAPHGPPHYEFGRRIVSRRSGKKSAS